jgi:hypothetical protein
MNTTMTIQSLEAMSPLHVELLSEEECMGITGGGAFAIGCLALAGGVGVAAIGVIIGVAIYALAH